jgi:neutral ceramidase
MIISSAGRRLAATLLASGALTASAQDLSIGLAKRDITGTPTGRPMMGYGDPLQKTAGVHTRLWARAFVVEKPLVYSGDTPRVAVVVADLGMIFASVRGAVLEKLKLAAPGRFDASNVVIMATHTHSGPGGFSHYDLYNSSTQGYDRANFETIVDGITTAILEADRHSRPGVVAWGEGELRGVSVNRSTVSYARNPERDRYQDDTDPTHTLLRFDDADGKPMGAFDWFAVHATSMSKHNHLISADNKGVATWLLERHMASQGHPEFMAAFANSNEGDASPNIFRGTPDEKKLSDVEKTERLGKLQYDAAVRLLKDALPIEVTRMRSRQVWVKMEGYRVEPEFTGKAEAVALCGPALGFSFAAGAEDGPSGLPGFSEGMRQGDPLPATKIFAPILMGLRAVLGGTKRGNECHAPKPILIAAGGENKELLPETMPFQLIEMAPLALAAVPAELTTTSGRRLRAMLEEKLAPLGVRRVIIAGLSNDYGHYVATPEEYALQQYEGASTLYGPNTLPAYLQIYSRLADSLLDPAIAIVSAAPPMGDAPPPRVKPLEDKLPRLPFDGRRPFESLGEVVDQPSSSYVRGDVAKAAFRSALPAAGQRQAFTIERLNGGEWETWSNDGVPGVSYRWRWDLCVACSRLSAEWRISRATPPGTYRFRHRGQWRSVGDGAPRAYESATKPFRID